MPTTGKAGQAAEPSGSALIFLLSLRAVVFPRVLPVSWSAMFGTVAGVLSVVIVRAVTAAAQSTDIQPSAYTVPGAFPTSLYSSYYNAPTATSAQPQPVISDPVTVSILHPFSLPID